MNDKTTPVAPSETPTETPAEQPPRRLFTVLLIIYVLWLTGLLLLNALT